MVHLEMSYLTHTKFSTMIIPDILPLFRARFRFFWWIWYFEFSSAQDLKLFFLFFAQGFGFFNKLILCPSVRARFKVLLKNDTSILFRPKFETDLWILILLSSSARGSKLISIYWYFYPLRLEIFGFFLNWCSALLSARGLEFFWKMIFLSSSACGLKLISDTSILLRSRFEADLWYFYPPPLVVLKLIWITDTSILLRSRFEVDLDLLILLSSPLEVRSWSLIVTCSLYWIHTWRPVKLGSVPILHLKIQSNL